MPNPNTPRKTNEELVSDLMNFSRHGALMQVFVLEALGRYSADCAAADPADLNTPHLSGQAWHGCATEVLQALAEHLGPADAGVQLPIDGM